MGYYSSFSVEVEDRRPAPMEALEGFRATCEAAPYAINPDGTTEDSVKWYDWQDDFLALSIANPGLLFTVRREGEETGDIEVGYFLDGKYQGGKAEFTLPEFKEDE